MNINVFEVAYYLFCFGFAIQYIHNIKGIYNKIGVGIVSFLLCPLLLAVEIGDYLENNNTR